MRAFLPEPRAFCTNVLTAALNASDVAASALQLSLECQLQHRDHCPCSHAGFS